MSAGTGFDFLWLDGCPDFIYSHWLKVWHTKGIWSEWHDLAGFMYMWLGRISSKTMSLMHYFHLILYEALSLKSTNNEIVGLPKTDMGVLWFSLDVGS